jgi:hypothetical protein
MMEAEPDLDEAMQTAVQEFDNAGILPPSVRTEDPIDLAHDLIVTNLEFRTKLQLLDLLPNSPTWKVESSPEAVKAATKTSLQEWLDLLPNSPTESEPA